MVTEIMGICFKLAIYFAVMAGAIELVNYISRKEKEND